MGRTRRPDLRGPHHAHPHAWTDGKRGASGPSRTEERPPQPGDLAHRAGQTDVRAHLAADACRNRSRVDRLLRGGDRGSRKIGSEEWPTISKRRELRFQAGTVPVDYDRAYANGPFIPGAETFPPRWTKEAAAFRAALDERARTAIPYGPGERNGLDLFLPEATPQGLLVFIHGGYWLRFGREMWSHLAAGALARGWACAMPSYTLAPEARINAMSQEIARAVEVAASLVAGPVVVAGHSAGGHLSARMGCAERHRCRPRQAGRADLAACGSRADLSDRNERQPAPRCGGNCAESPALLALRPGVEAHVWVGAQERPAFLWQARLLSEAWSCPWTPESGKHHFDVIDGLADPASALLSVCLD